MKHKNNNQSKNETFFKNLASSYAEKSGNELKQELTTLNSFQPTEIFDNFDKKVKSRIQANKIKKWTSRLMPVAACFIIFIICFNIFRLPVNNYNNFSDSDFADNNVQENSPVFANLNFEFISEKLPSEYTLEKIDYDNQKAVYYIVSNKNAEVILTVEKFKGNIDTEGLDKIPINDKTAYGVSKEDFSFIQYKKDNLLYILTSPDDYVDLIRISKYLI